MCLCLLLSSITINTKNILSYISLLRLVVKLQLNSLWFYFYLLCIFNTMVVFACELQYQFLLPKWQRNATVLETLIHVLPWMMRYLQVVPYMEKASRRVEIRSLDGQFYLVHMMPVFFAFVNFKIFCVTIMCLCICVYMFTHVMYEYAYGGQKSIFQSWLFCLFFMYASWIKLRSPWLWDVCLLNPTISVAHICYGYNTLTKVLADIF